MSNTHASNHMSTIMIVVFIARRAIPMIAFHGVESIYIYIYKLYIFSCVHLREHALYT